MELVRLILLVIGAAADAGFVDVAVPGYTEEEVSYHVMLLAKHSLIEAVDLSGTQGHCWKPLRLTWDGHDFIDAIRSETVWNKTKSFLFEKTGTLSIEAITVALPTVLKMLLQ